MTVLTEEQQEEIVSMEREKHRLWKEDMLEAKRFRHADMRLRITMTALLAVELVVVIGWLVAWVKVSI